MAGEHARLTLFALACAALAASAVLLVRSSEPASAPDSKRVLSGGAAQSVTSLDRHGQQGLGRQITAGDAALAEDLAAGERLDPAIAAERAVLAETARRFLASFSHYEVGDLRPSVRAGLRATASRDFVAALLRAPPRPLAGPRPRRAHLVGIELTFLPGQVPRAVLGGTLRRGTALESFAFEFERAGALWLAVGVGG